MVQVPSLLAGQLHGLLTHMHENARDTHTQVTYIWPPTAPMGKYGRSGRKTYTLVGKQQWQVDLYTQAWHTAEHTAEAAPPPPMRRRSRT